MEYPKNDIEDYAFKPWDVAKAKQPTKRRRSKARSAKDTKFSLALQKRIKGRMHLMHDCLFIPKIHNKRRPLVASPIDMVQHNKNIRTMNKDVENYLRKDWHIFKLSCPDCGTRMTYLSGNGVRSTFRHSNSLFSPANMFELIAGGDAGALLDSLNGDEDCRYAENLGEGDLVVIDNAELRAWRAKWRML